MWSCLKASRDTRCPCRWMPNEINKTMGDLGEPAVWSPSTQIPFAFCVIQGSKTFPHLAFLSRGQYSTLLANLHFVKQILYLICKKIDLFIDWKFLCITCVSPKFFVCITCVSPQIFVYHLCITKSILCITCVLPRIFLCIICVPEKKFVYQQEVVIHIEWCMNSIQNIQSSHFERPPLAMSPHL